MLDNIVLLRIKSGWCFPENIKFYMLFLSLVSINQMFYTIFQAWSRLPAPSLEQTVGSGSLHTGNSYRHPLDLQAAERVSARTQNSIWSVADPPFLLLPKPHCSTVQYQSVVCLFWYHRPKQHLLQQLRWKRFSHLSEMIYKLLFNDHQLSFVPNNSYNSKYGILLV